ncbi:MAG TPA: T9SS type A sorting domain-containing protein [Bacteroidia bacterium]|nr:T9SS type A sorting domain-containing protein [Bacteroidia bacterium]
MFKRSFTRLPIYAILIFFVLIASEVAAQFLSPTGVVDSLKTPDTSSLSLSFSEAPGPGEQVFSGQVPCHPSSFWVISQNTNLLQEFQLVNSVITPTGITYPSYSFLMGLAYANDNSGISGMSPTFFATGTFSPSSLHVFDGSSWDTISSFPVINFLNCSGFENDVYVDGYTTSSVFSLFHYSNGIISTVYTCPPGRLIMVADQAVDANGNVYFFVGPATFPYHTDSLFVMNSSGNLLKSFPVSFNCANAYGCFMLGDTLYVGLGIGNQINPATLLPVKINQNTATIGTPIPFTFTTGNFSDLESCNPGMPVGLPASVEVAEELSVFPNPAINHLTVKLPKLAGSQIEDVILITPQGRQIHTKYLYNNNDLLQLQFENMAQGLYFVKIRVGSKIYYGKFDHIKN